MSLPLVYPANHEGLPAMQGCEAGVRGFEDNPWPPGSEEAEIWEGCREWVRGFPNARPPFGFFAHNLNAMVH